MTVDADKITIGQCLHPHTYLEKALHAGFWGVSHIVLADEPHRFLHLGNKLESFNKGDFAIAQNAAADIVDAFEFLESGPVHARQVKMFDFDVDEVKRKNWITIEVTARYIDPCADPKAQAIFAGEKRPKDIWTPETLGTIYITPQVIYLHTQFAGDFWNPITEGPDGHHEAVRPIVTAFARYFVKESICCVGGGG